MISWIREIGFGGSRAPPHPFDKHLISGFNKLVMDTGILEFGDPGHQEAQKHDFRVPKIGFSIRKIRFWISRALAGLTMISGFQK